MDLEKWNNAGHLNLDLLSHSGLETYPLALKKIGYHTCHIGKSHLYPHVPGRHLEECKSFMQRLGWDEVLETTGPWATVRTDSIMTDHWRRIGCLKTSRNDYLKRREVGPTKALWPSPMPEEEHLDAFIGRLAVEYLSNYNRKEPFLLFVGFGGPYPPFDPPPS